MLLIIYKNLSFRILFNVKMFHFLLVFFLHYLKKEHKSLKTSVKIKEKQKCSFKIIQKGFTNIQID